MKPSDFDTPKHAEFVVNYFKLNMNGTQAYKATYGQDLDDNSAAVNAHKLLRNTKIAQVVHDRIQQNIMEADELLSRVSQFARSEHGLYLKEDGTVDIAKLVKDGKGHLLKAIKDTKYGRVFEFHDPKQYLEMQGKYYALWKDKLEIELSPLESEVVTLLKNGDVTVEQVLKTLGDNDRTRQLIANIK